MPQHFELDEFDRAPAHGGRHRIRRTGSIRVREWISVFVVTVAVTGVGFYGFKLLGDTNNFTNFVPNETAAEPQVPGTIGPGVAVIDASGKEQLATTVAAKLVVAGFNVLAARNLDALSVPGGTSSSAVYVKDSANNDTAERIAKELGGLKVSTSTSFDAAITVVLGTSFSG